MKSNLVQELSKNSLLQISLLGARTVFERELGIKNIPITTDNTVKGEIKRKGNGEYPYAYIQLSDLAIYKDRNPNKNVQRHGYRVGMTGAARATIAKGYLFPIRVGFEVKYIDNDPYRVLIIAEAMAILSGIGGMNFSVKLDDNQSLDVVLEIPDTIPIPVSDTGNTESPAGQEVSLAVVMSTYAGFFRQVAAVNSDRAVADYEIIYSEPDYGVQTPTTR